MTTKSHKRRLQWDKIWKASGIHEDFSPTAIASRSSAMVKASGQSCCRTLWFSGADPSWAATSFRLERFCGRFTKVQASLPKFRGVSGLLGQIHFRVPKGSVEGSPIASLNLSPSSSTLLRFFPQQR